MKTIVAPRASAILYNLLSHQAAVRPWLMPANICPIVPVTFLKARVPFEFVDISARTLHMDLDQAEARLKRASWGGVLYAHTYGEPTTPTAFFEYVKTRSPETLVVDDRCLCIPQLDAGQSNVPDVTLHSTGPSKTVELGFGGYAFIAEHVYYRERHLSFSAEAEGELVTAYKRSITEHSRFSYRESDWLQTTGPPMPWSDYSERVRGSLPRSLARRSALNAVYRSRLPREIQLADGFHDWRFNIRLKNRKAALDAIFEAGLFASSHFASLAGIIGEGSCPQAERLAGEAINLFNDEHFDRLKAERTCDLIVEKLAAPE